MSARGRRLLWLLIAVGTAARLVLAFATVGHGFDIQSWHIAGTAFNQDPLHTYEIANPRELADEPLPFRWPYPPGMLPWAGLSVWIADELGVAFHGVVQLLPIAADAALAFLVQAFLGRRGAGEGIRLAGAALVALGPSFGAISGYHGHFDSVAALAAVGALYLWETHAPSRRAMRAGLLTGAGIAVKTVPGLVLLALLPSSRRPREGIRLVAWCALVPVATALPFLIADGSDFVRIRDYAGGPGGGGISMLIQPNLVAGDLVGDPNVPTHLTLVVNDHASQIVAAAMLLTAAFLLWVRPPAVEAAVLVWLAFYALDPNYFPQYIVWGLPFFLVAGHLKKVALLQTVLLPPMLVTYLKPWEDEKIAILYVGPMAVVWIGWATALTVQVLRMIPSRPAGFEPATSASGGQRSIR